MEHKNSLIDRGHALENAFFHEVDEKLLTNLREKMMNEELRKALEDTLHFEDAGLISELIELGICPETLVAVNLIPLILVAWSNHRVTEAERLAVLEAAADEGIDRQSSAYGLLDHWLRTEPDKLLGQTWEHYIRELAKTLTPDALSELQTNVFSRARAVAKAARSVLDFDHHIDVEENRVLNQLKGIFSEV